MPLPISASRTAGLLAVAVALSTLTACASEPEPRFIAPTMAPDQSVAEACAVSGAEIDRITRQTEEQLRAGIEQAGADLAAGRVPSFEFLATPIDDAVAQVERQITNSEVLDAINEVREALQGFGDIERPDTLLGTPGYVGALTSQLNKLAQAGSRLQSICVVEGQG